MNKIKKSTITVDKELATKIKIAAAQVEMTIGQYVQYMFKVIEDNK